MITHLMLDEETLCKRPGGVVLSAALMRVHDEASVKLNISIPDQQALGLEIDPETHAWWGAQEAANPGIWARATENPTPLVDALNHFSAWIAWAVAGASDWRIWCHGAPFDCPILQEVYRKVGITCPWEFWQVRCTRTAYELAGVDKTKHFVPPLHDALSDATTQTRALVASFQVLQKVHAQ